MSDKPEYYTKKVDLEDRLAHILSEISNDAAPIGWTKYRFEAGCLLAAEDVRKIFKELEISTRYQKT